MAKSNTILSDSEVQEFNVLLATFNGAQNRTNSAKWAIVKNEKFAQYWAELKGQKMLEGVDKKIAKATAMLAKANELKANPNLATPSYLTKKSKKTA